MKLSFMTFVLPEWEIEKIVDFARNTDYDGVEIRVDAGHRHGISSQSDPQTRRSVRKLFENEGVDVACVATSVRFNCPDESERRGNIEAAKRNLDLAADLGAKVVRIFAGKGTPEFTDEAVGWVAEAFDEVGEYAAGSGVCPVLETGHDIVRTAVEGARVIEKVKTSNFGVLWNHSEMDAQTFDLLKSHLRHIHVHEEVLDPDNDNILHLSKLLKGIGYSGYISLEIIKGKNLPLDLLAETGKRLKGFISDSSF